MVLKFTAEYHCFLWIVEMTQSLGVSLVEKRGLLNSPRATSDRVGLEGPSTVALSLDYQREFSDDQLLCDHNYPKLESMWKSLPLRLNPSFEYSISRIL